MLHQSHALRRQATIKFAPRCNITQAHYRILVAMQTHYEIFMAVQMQGIVLYSLSQTVPVNP